MDRYVGYEITETQRQAGLVGQATIDGQICSHLLSPHLKQALAVDVGRNENSELVWVCALPDSTTAHIRQHFIPQEPQLQQESESEPTERLPVIVHQLSWFNRIKPAWILGISAGIVLCFLGYFLIPSSSEAQKATPEPPPVQSKSTEPTQPEQAAIDFVLQGEVAGIFREGNLNANQVDARILSKSGELVLVEVFSTQAQETTIIATLLLQKNQQTWRIRQVYN